MKIGKITNCADFQTANAYSDTFTSGNNGNGSNVGIKSKRGIIGSSNNVSTNGAACPSGNYSNAVSGSGSGGNSEHESETTRTLDVVDQLHDLFRNMSIFDETPESTREPIPPNNFLQAVGKLNPMFEGMPCYRYVTQYFALISKQDSTLRTKKFICSKISRQSTAGCP